MSERKVERPIVSAVWVGCVWKSESRVCGGVGRWIGWLLEAAGACEELG